MKKVAKKENAKYGDLASASTTRGEAKRVRPKGIGRASGGRRNNDIEEGAGADPYADDDEGYVIGDSDEDNRLASPASANNAGVQTHRMDRDDDLEIIDTSEDEDAVVPATDSGAIEVNYTLKE